MKKLIFVLIFLVPLLTYASYSSELISDKEDMYINETVSIQAKLEYEGDMQAIFNNLYLNDNFEILESSSFNSSDNHITIINGRTSNVSKSKIVINMILRPQKVGDLIIGPAEFELNGEKITTNRIEITVNSSPNSSNNVKTDNSKFYKMIYYLIGAVVLVLMLNFAAIINMRKNKKNISSEEKGNIKKEIIFPGINEQNFEDKIHTIFLDLLDEKYYINGIYSKTSQEILDYIDNEHKGDIEEILKLFDIVKYSPTKEGKEILLLKVQEFYNFISKN